jgi:hypothetical protein
MSGGLPAGKQPAPAKRSAPSTVAQECAAIRRHTAKLAAIALADQHGVTRDQDVGNYLTTAADIMRRASTSPRSRALAGAYRALALRFKELAIIRSAPTPQGVRQFPQRVRSTLRTLAAAARNANAGPCGPTAAIGDALTISFHAPPSTTHRS